MATVTWRGNATNVPQIVTRTFNNTWATADTATVTINGNDMVVTLGTTQTAAGIAAAVAAAFNLSERLTATAGPADGSTSNVGGQTIPEFKEITASVSSATVTFTANTAGKPFTLTVTVDTAGTGDVTGETVVQAATGMNHWDNADNWDSGSVPANDDIVVFRDSDVSVKYGLPAASREVTFNVYQSFTGQIGLPRINNDANSAAGRYLEYRPRMVHLDDAGTGTNILHVFGLGEGNGSPLINLRHDTLQCSVLVYNTGRPSVQGDKALNIVCENTSSELTILRGSVDAGSDFSASAGWNVIRVNNSQGQTSDVRIAGADASNAVIVSGGQVAIENTTGITFTQYGGTIDATGVNSAAAISLYGGVFKWSGSGTITAMTIDGGDFDARGGLSAFTVTNCTRRRGPLRDPFHRATWSNAIQNFGGVTDLDFGSNFSLTPVAI